MREAGVNVLLVSSPDKHLSAAGVREGVEVMGLKMAREINVGRDLRALWEWVRLMHRVRPDVVNVGTPKAALLGTAAAYLMRVPQRIYVVRGLRYEGVRGRTRSVLVFLERLTVAMSTEVIVVSGSVGRAMTEEGILRGRSFLLMGSGSSNGVDVRAVERMASHFDRPTLLSQVGWGADVYVVGFVGRLNRDKGAETLVEALRLLHLRHPSVALLCIGDVEEPYLALKFQRSGVPVKLTGWTDQPWKYFSAVDVLALPTRREGFPNVVLEAAAVGIPTVTTRATGAVDAVIDGVTGLIVDVDDPTGFAGALEILLIDGERRQRMGAAARKRAETDFAPAIIWQGLLDLYAGGAE